LILARYLAEQYQATLILTARSAIDETIETNLAALRQLTRGEVIYLPGDVTDPTQMAAILTRIKSSYGRLNGLMHAAGIQSSGTIDQTAWREFAQVLAPKVEGALIVDEVTKDEDLDLFVLFSSTAAVVGDFGSGDYAIANRFLDEFAHWRAKLVEQKQRKGHSLSLNWPLWREGGMKFSPEAATLYLQSSGQQFLESAEGLRLFEQSLSSTRSQVIVFSGQMHRIRQFLGLESVSVQAEEPFEEDRPSTGDTVVIEPNGPALSEERLKRLIVADLKRQVSTITKAKTEQLDGDENLGAFGLDSIMLKQLAVNLDQQYEVELTPTVFFEHSTVNGLSEFLLEQHREMMAAYYQAQLGQAKIDSPTTGVVKPPPTSPKAVTSHRVQETAPVNAQAVAIVGISGIMPQSPDVATFWQHLAAGHDLVTEIPPERWDWRNFYDPSGQDPNKSRSKWGGFIPDVDKFDPLFFKISPREAEMMDPQHRLFLQTVWHCIEDGGYRASDLAGRQVGVYVGVQFQEYPTLIAWTLRESKAQMATGNGHAMLANRVSYLLDLHGPSEAIDTACSSSLVALHRAVQSIRSGEIESAIVGGVSLALSPATYIATSHMGVLSPDGRCKTFDKSANGYVKGEGVGAVLLKPLGQAEQDGDHIYGLIRGSAENHGGRATSL
ncbi:MAG: SDR family oxidoreductase, partial [Anaerolineae bacterium]|nr:SDR family oxidoreductase [Anaerolineae bacterium]